MPDASTIALLVGLAAGVVGVVTGIVKLSGFLHGRIRQSGADRRELRREGAAVVTPVQEVINAIAPPALAWGGEEQVNDHLRSWHENWIARRQTLMTFGNTHRGTPIYQRTEALAAAVDREMGAARWLVIQQFRHSDGLMDAYETATARRDEADAAADALLDALG